MDFFEHQASAKRQTGRLVAYFLTAVLLIVMAVNLAFYVLGSFMLGKEGSPLWHDWSFQAVIGTLILIGGGSLREYLALRDGGRAVASMVRARQVDFATTHLNERQLLNIVEEMAIASGVKPPMVYVMDAEYGINAFVAGLSLDDTVMVVTQGALDAFDRDEMQAVVGHEFSHILHGDARLNIRLMALLAGILAIGQLGGFLMRLGWGRHERLDRRSERRGGLHHFFLFGLLLWLIGYIGLFFGRLIKAAISRQREFLADAASVQFTRNPSALANALLKIMYADDRSWLLNLHAEDMSHLCFGETLHFSGLLATHPPLEERIRVLGAEYLVRGRVRHRALRKQQERAIDCMQDDVPVDVVQSTVRADLPPIPFVGVEAPEAAGQAAVASGEAAAREPVASLLSRAGSVNPVELASAVELHRRLPEGIRHALQTSGGAQALLFALVARQNGMLMSQLNSFLREQLPQMETEVVRVYGQLEGLGMRFSLPLTELALPRLQVLPVHEQKELLSRLQLLARLDGQVSTFEFALLMLLRKQLHKPVIHPVKLKQCLDGVSLVIAILLHAGGLRGQELERMHARLMRTLTPTVMSFPAVGASRLSQLARDVQTLAGLSLQERKQVLELAATAVLADAEVQLEEYELLRVVSALLDCPMPLLVV
jgi:Zn-dependent protease with chaperone function